jgi:uncharacterized protein (DUF58 family)
VESSLLRSGDYELIKSLSIHARKRVAGFSSGEQRSPALGGGIEFADYREYMGGDDIRQIDWPVYLRYRKLLVKLCAEEKELTLMILLDLSGSMSYGVPEKAVMAKRLACVLAGIAAQGGNRYGIASCANELREALRPGLTRLPLSSMVREVARMPVGGDSSPAGGMRQFASRYGRRCMVVFISDMLYPDWSRTLAGLAASGCEAHLLHVLSPDEIDPPQRGELTLIDMEDDAEIPLHADASVLSRYRGAMASLLKEQRDQCGALGIEYSQVLCDASLERVFRQDLRKGGLVC